MNSLPTILYPNHDEQAQQMFFEDSMCYGFPSGGAIFYSLRDGDWSDRTMWETVGNAGINGVPSADDVVYIRHNVTFQMFSLTIKGLFVVKTLYIIGTTTLSITDSLEGNGTIDTSGSGNCIIIFYGYRGGFSGTILFNTFIYTRTGTQYLLPCTHPSVQITGGGVKYARSDVFLNGLLIGNDQTLELGIYNLYATGTVGIGGNQNRVCLLLKNGYGNVLFTGLLSIGNVNKAIDFSGNPDVECQGGINRTNDVQQSRFGTGTWRFTTNNQTLAESGSGQFSLTHFYGKVIIEDITVEANNIIFDDTLDGTTSGSTFKASALSLTPTTDKIYYRATTQPMATGVLDSTDTTQTFIYDKAGAQEIKGTTYGKLTIAGSGVKTLMGDVTVTTLYTKSGSSTIDLNGFTLTTP